jgi:hypothetical protein
LPWWRQHGRSATLRAKTAQQSTGSLRKQCRQNTLDPPDHEPCRAEHNPGRDARQLHPRRYTRELSLDEVDLVFDRGEVGAREADLAQCEGVLVWYALGRGRLGERFINR